MALEYVRRIADPVHGSVPLTNVELEVIGSKAFQRLRGIKQLGLAHLVFPSADFSRFAHSIGVCHVTGRIIASLRQKQVAISDDEEQQYRLAALLHDVGHYPYSHTTEHALKNFYSAKLMEPASGRKARSKPPLQAAEHEEISKLIVHRDREISKALRTANIKAVDVTSIFTRERPPRFANLVSSDLDADRMDYLVRTAKHTGLPYGRIDLDYLIDQLMLDQAKPPHLCLPIKALRTVEHFALGRFFEYQQLVSHKTVAALEKVLEDVIGSLLTKGLISWDSKTVEQMVVDGSWADIDDSYLFELIRETGRSRQPNLLAEQVRAIVRRKPPRLIGEMEFYDRAEHASDANLYKKVVEDCISELAKMSGISRQYWFVLHRTREITKARSLTSRSDANGDGQDDQLEQVVHIQRKGRQKSEPVIDLEFSLLHELSNIKHHLLRLYVLVPSGKRPNMAILRERLLLRVPSKSWK